MKPKLPTVLLFTLYCILPLIIILTSHHMRIADTLSKIGRDYYGDSCAIFQLENISDSKTVTESLDDLKGNVAVYSDRTDDTGIIRSIYFKGSYVDFPMQSGRFLEESDFKENNYVCVIGKNRTNEVTIRNNHNFITINHHDYMVLGVVGYEESTLLDNDIFINMNAATVTGKILTYDFLGKNDDINDITEQLLSYYNNLGYESKLRSEDTSFADTIMPSLLSARWFYLLFLACLLALMLMSSQWIEVQKESLIIHRMTGATIFDVIKILLTKYIGIFLFSFFIGFIYCRIIYPSYIYSLYIGYAVCAVVISGFLIHSIRIVIKTPMDEVLK